MSYPIYSVPAGDVLPIFFSTYSGTTGASITMTGLAVTDIEIYKDGGTTQRASDAGYTLLDTDGIDVDGITGIHGFSIDTGDNTDAGFYTVGAWFHVVVSAVTVDGQTVSFIAAAFRLMAAEAVAAKPKVDVDAWLGTAAATPTVAGVPEVDLTHVAGATTNVSALATNVDAILTDTADMQPKLGTPAGASMSADILAIDNLVDDLESRLGTPSDLGGGATIAANLSDIEAQTDDIGAAGAGLTALASAANLATLTGYVDTEVAAIKAKTDNLPSDPADASDIAASHASLSAKIDAVDDYLDTELPALTAAVQGLMLASGTIGATGNDATHLHLSGLAYADDAINSMLITIKDVSTGLFYARWIEDFANTGDLATVATLPFTPEASVDQYWILPVRADVTGGSGLDAAGVRAAIGLSSANLDTQLTAIDDYLDTEIAAIKAKTDNLPSDPADASDLASSFSTVNSTLSTIAGYLDTEIAAIKAKTDNLPTDPADQSAVESAITTAQAAILAKMLKYVQLTLRKDAAIATDNATEVTAINADGGSGAGAFANTTDAQEALRDRGDAAWVTATGFSTLDAAGVRSALGLASANLDTQLSTIDDFLDTEIAAIKAKTDNLPTDPADASDIATSFSSITSTLATIAGYLDTEVAAIKAKTDNLPTDPADESALEAAITAAQNTVTAAISALNNLSAAQVNAEVVDALATDVIADSVPADGSRPTIAQALYLLTQFMTERSVSSTTMTVKKPDGSTTLMTFTLDSATAPTSITRAS